MTCLLPLLVLVFSPIAILSGNPPECTDTDQEFTKSLREKVYSEIVGKLGVELQYDCGLEKRAWKQLILVDKSFWPLPNGAYEKEVKNWPINGLLSPRTFFQTVFALWKDSYDQVGSYTRIKQS
ncbi:hypothetical protein Y032_0015g2861 [Ancylostoma ceylanicum]|nr:hypothetical protein Y032_0015g2861 [Ancylostoma ceylanicum]